jgi:hypothetical protein
VTDFTPETIPRLRSHLLTDSAVRQLLAGWLYGAIRNATENGDPITAELLDRATTQYVESIDYIVEIGVALWEAKGEA